MSTSTSTNTKVTYGAVVNAAAESGDVAGLAIIEAVENQLKDNNPPEANDTLNRLMSMGERRENAMRYIATVFSIEIFEIIKNETPYNEKRYIRNLKGLPRLPKE